MGVMGIMGIQAPLVRLRLWLADLSARATKQEKGLKRTGAWMPAWLTGE